MIPSDLAARLRLFLDSAVQPVTPAAEIHRNLPDFHPGQRFVARIEAPLPDGTFRALVAGKQLTLSLPQSAKAGDTLELVVTERTPQLITAARADAAEAQPPTLSRAAQLISVLMGGREGSAGRAAVGPLDPLLAQPARAGDEIAPALRSAIARSGLFYESHQAQWVAGRYPLAELLKEPQGRHSSATRSANARAALSAGMPGRDEPSLSPQVVGDRQAPLPAPLPPDLLPIVQQQLDAASLHQVVWMGEVWPGQTLSWEIHEDPHEPSAASGEDAASRWSTRLRLTLPQLGDVEVDLTLDSSGVAIRVQAGEESARRLGGGQMDLATRLSGAGLRVACVTIEHHAELG